MAIEDAYVFHPSEDWKREFAVCNYSKARESGKLNKQVIPILEMRGVPAESFSKLSEMALDLARSEGAKLLEADGKELQRILRRIVADSHGGPAAEVLQAMRQAKFDPTTEPYLRDQLERCARLMVREATDRFRFPIEKSMKGMFVPDPTNTLKPGEVFLHCTRLNPDTSMEYGTITGPVVLFQSPCLLDSDVLKLVAVDPHASASAEIRSKAEASLNMAMYLRDVIVLNRKDHISVANRLSGGDLDGDIGVATWEPLIIDFVPTKNADPPTAEEEKSAWQVHNISPDETRAGLDRSDKGSSEKPHASTSRARMRFGHPMVVEHAIQNLGALTLVRFLSLLHMDRIDLWITLQREMQKDQCGAPRKLCIPDSHMHEMRLLAFCNRAALDAPKHGGCPVVESALSTLPCLKNFGHKIRQGTARGECALNAFTKTKNGLYGALYSVPTPHYSGRARRASKVESTGASPYSALSAPILDIGLARAGVPPRLYRPLTESHRPLEGKTQLVFESKSVLARLAECIADSNLKTGGAVRGRKVAVDTDLVYADWRRYQEEAQALLQKIANTCMGFSAAEAGDEEFILANGDGERDESISVDQQRRFAATLFEAFSFELLSRKGVHDRSGMILALASAMYVVGNRQGTLYRNMAWYACGKLFVAMKGNPILKKAHEPNPMAVESTPDACVGPSDGDDKELDDSVPVPLNAAEEDAEAMPVE